MHRFLKSIGFSEYTSTKKISSLLQEIITSPDEKKYTASEESDHTLIVEFSKNFAENMGISVCGEYDEDNKFILHYYFPYCLGTTVSSVEDVSVERHASEDSYAGVCDDIKVGVSLIFYLQNKIPYIKYNNAGSLPVIGTTLTLSALADQGSIMMPIIKNENQKKKIRQAMINRNQLIEAARKGDEDAIESLTLEDMDTYTTISKKIQKEDVFSLVDTYFMPYGVECDQYSVLGEIIECRQVTNRISGEKIYLMTLDCNELNFDVCINQLNLFGEPKKGRRFKGVVWLQGYINYPD